MRYITQAEAEVIKKLLLNGNLASPIRIRGTVYDANIASLGSVFAPAHEYYRMKGRYCRNKADDPIRIQSKPSDLMIRVGEWGYPTRLHDTHITIGSSGIHSYFCQLELSQCIANEKNVYLLKQLTGLAGEGTMMRLNKNAASTAEKHARRVQLVKRLGVEVMDLNDKEWLIVSTVPLSELKNSSQRNKLLTRVLGDILRYAFAVEEIIVQPQMPTKSTKELLAGTEQSGNDVIYFPSPEDRQAIEEAAQSFAEDFFRKKGYAVEDCSMKGGLGYDLCIRNGKTVEYVEVKGTTNDDWCIEMQRSQHDAAGKHGKKFHLFVVVLKSVKNLKPKKLHDIVDPLNASLKIEPSTYSVRL